MKKMLCALLSLALLLSLAACGGADPETSFEWTRQGFFADENENMLSITWMDDEDHQPGWYVGCMIGDIMAGWIVQQEGETLHGNLNAWDESLEPFVITVSEEGEDGVMLVIEGGETYHFTPMEMEEATIFVSINTEGIGCIEYAEGETAPEIDEEYPFQSAQINLAEPAVHTFVAWTKEEGWSFTKWTRNGEDFSTEAQITVLLDESADYVAVFDYDGEGSGEFDGQNPVMNFMGPYMCDRASAMVEAEGSDWAKVSIVWGSSAWEQAEWVMSGPFVVDTLTVEYSNCVLTYRTFDENGAVTEEKVQYENGTGRFVFNADDLSFTWEDDQEEREAPMVFEWAL